MSKMSTELHRSPFYVLQVTTRDGSAKIVEAAEERSLFADDEVCRKARSDLTNPRTRLSAEVAWMPGVAPSTAARLVGALSENPQLVRAEEGLPTLARANLMAAALELIDLSEPGASIAEFIRDFARVVEAIDSDVVMRDTNEDRTISGFPEVRSIDAIEDALSEQRRTYRSALKSLLDKLGSQKIIETMTDVVSVATHDGEEHAPALIDDLVDSYEVETHGFLQKEYENMAVLIRGVKEAARRDKNAVTPALEKLELVARNWDRVAQPIQVSAKSRGIVHQPSREVALELRDLAIELHNEHGMLDHTDRITQLLREIFAELPETAEILHEDANTILELRRESEEQERNKAEWQRASTFRADVGALFKEELSISPQGIAWKGRIYALDSITRVRWGAVRRSINGIPTGTDYTIAFGDNRTEQVIQLRKETTYDGFVSALWRAVCVRLIIEMIEELENGRSFSFDNITVEDEGVILAKHKLFGKETVRLNWREVHVWSGDGSFYIGKIDDKKVYGSASYITTPNVHILEHIIRGGFKKGVNRLSAYLRG